MTFESSTAFMAFRAGDLINTGGWEGSNSPMEVLGVLGVEHFASDNGERILHGIKVFTEKVGGSKDIRFIED